MRKLLSTIGVVLMIAALAVPGVALASPATTASRDLPTTVAPGAGFNVAITASDYGMMGQVLETLPAGFSYVSSSLDASQVRVTGNVVKFVLLGETSFTYSVTASTTAATYTFSGIIKNADLNEYTVSGDTQIIVSGAPPATTASRDLPATVAPGAPFPVSITASGYGTMGQVLETLPAGFSYVSSSLDASQVRVTGNVVKFVLLGEASFTYSVTAATVADTYTFSGIIKDEDANEYTIGGDTDITVGPVGAYDRLLPLHDGWTLLSTDKWIDAESSAWVGTATLVLKHTAQGFLSATFADLEPVEALYVKMPGGGWAGLNYADVAPGVSAKDLVAGWNLISSATANSSAAAILSPLRYVQVGQQQGVCLTTVVSQGNYNVSGRSFYLSALTDADWTAQTPWSLAFTPLCPFDGFWVYMNAAKSFGVIPE
jgi:hypothetical protein